MLALFGIAEFAGRLLGCGRLDTLKKVWKSGAMEQWEREFQLLIAKLRTQLKEMQKLILVLGEAADRLAQIEKDMMYDAEKL